MFQAACKSNREAIYGVWGFTKVANNRQLNGTGSGFAIAPGILATCAHVLHPDGDTKKPIHANFWVIRSPDIGQNVEVASFIAEDPKKDIALLKIASPRSTKFLTLDPSRVQSGTCCGSMGFPLCQVEDTPQGPKFILVERFQGSYVSAYVKQVEHDRGVDGNFYEIDTLMYGGSSGCPAFLMNANVIGMQSRYRNNVQGTQLSISMLVPSPDIIKFAQGNGMPI